MNEGNLDPGTLARQFYACASQKASGRLVLERADETLTFSLLDGRPVHVSSSLPGDRFGRWMVDGGRLAEAKYGDAAKRAVEKGIELGQALIDAQALNDATLAKHRADYARTLVVDRFRLEPGTFRFEAGRSPSERSFQLDVLPVVAEGFKKHADAAVVQRILGDREKRYFAVRGSVEDLERTFILDSEETAFLRFGGRAYNVADAAELSGLPLREAGKLLALLWTCDRIEDFTPSVTEFEARINEEKDRARESRSIDLGRGPPPDDDEPAPIAIEIPVAARDYGRPGPDIILSAVDDYLAADLEQTAIGLGMDVLVETHDEGELERALALSSPLIGVNNRDLKRMVTDLSVTERLAPSLPGDRVLISESGLSAPAQLARLRQCGVRCFLIGESLMREGTNRQAAVTRLRQARSD
ncbi:MAG: DUF4388 domain-containing protein [Myxococcales bacterium]|nr:DUF4388 domain-containing protein [Myxococcales bacterium]